MDDKNVTALRRVYQQWSKGNFRPTTGVYDADLEWGWSDEFLDIAGVERDPRSQRLTEWLKPWEHWRVEAEDYIAAGDVVVVMCRYTGRGKGSGVDVDTEGAHVWTMRDGRGVRLEVFSSRARALRAAGIDYDGPGRPS